MGNTVMVAGFELYRSLLSSSSISTSHYYPALMAGKMGPKSKFVVANYFASSSEGEQEFEEVANLQSPEFEPFSLLSEDTGKN